MAKKLKVIINKALDDMISVEGLPEEHQELLRENKLENFKFISYDIKSEKAKLIQDFLQGKKLISIRRLQSILDKKSGTLNNKRVKILIQYLLGIKNLKCFYFEISKDPTTYSKYQGDCSTPSLGLNINSFVEHHGSKRTYSNIEPYIGEYIYKWLPDINDIYVYDGNEYQLANEIIKALEEKAKKNIQIGLFDLDTLETL